jgi:hypothetical protein
MVFFLEITNICKSLKTFGSWIFFLRFLKSKAWYGFSIDFWLFWMYFINFCLKLLLILNFSNVTKDGLEKQFCFIGWCRVLQIHKLGPVD